MSILIKGMEMPKSCSECWFYDDSRCPLFSYGVPNRYNYDALTMPDWCELIELPPHGRLVDADALIVDLMDRGVEGLQTDDWHEIQQAVADAPTVIEAEGEE